MSRTYRHRLTIEQAASAGDFEREMEPVKKVGEIYGALLPMSGRELEVARQVYGQVTHKIRTRYRDDIKPDMYLRKGDRLFEIQSVVNVGEMNRWLEIVCIEST